MPRSFYLWALPFKLQAGALAGGGRSSSLLSSVLMPPRCLSKGRVCWVPSLPASLCPTCQSALGKCQCGITQGPVFPWFPYPSTQGWETLCLPCPLRKCPFSKFHLIPCVPPSLGSLSSIRLGTAHFSWLPWLLLHNLSLSSFSEWRELLILLNLPV